MAPITLSKAQFAKTSAARTGGTYSKYLSYLAAHRVALAPVDPFAPLTDAQLNQQASHSVHAQVDPLIAQITHTINARTAQGQKALSGLTDTYAKNVGGMGAATKNDYAGAESNQAALDSSLSQRLTGQGTSQSSELAQKLGAIGSPVAGQASAGLGAVAGNAANTNYANGSASLASLIAQGAGAKDYADKMPGIARSQGLQASGALQQNATNDLATQTGAVTSRVPSLIDSILTSLRGRELQKATIEQSGVLKGEQNRIAANKAATDAAYKAGTLAEKGRHDKASEGTAASRARTAAAQVTINATKAQRSTAAKPSAALSGKYGYIVDQYGHAILNQKGKKIPVAKTGKAKTKPTTTLVP